MTVVTHHRRSSFALVFATLSVAIAFNASGSVSIAWQVVLGWMAMNAMMLSIAYFMNWPYVFGKTKDGSFRWPIAVLMAPILLFIRIVWQLQNAFVRIPLYNQISPDLFVGRRCGYESLPEGVTVVVDLTAEFQAPHSLRGRVQTICLPTLDGCPPDWTKCQEVFEILDKAHHRIYACCANGHGRSVTFMAAWLGREGLCHSAVEAVALIRAARPTASPNQDQMSFLNHVFETKKPTADDE